MKSAIFFLSAAFAAGTTASLYGQSELNHTCVLDPDYKSCSKRADPELVDPCCVETFGGLVLLTQFWSTYTGLEDEGQLLPADRWGIHGLWPDFCNGSYTQYCDLERQYDPVPSPNTTNGQPDGTPVPAYTGPHIDPWTEFGKADLLDYMNTYWISRDEENYVLWVHEYSKHATCFSTFDTPCYGPKHQPQEDVIEYFETTIMYDQRLPTYDWLAASEIVPSNETTYSLSDFEDALSSEYGAIPYIGCSGPRYNETDAGADSDDGGRTVLSEAWYFFNVKGRPQEGKWAPVERTGSSSCTTAEGGISYPLRSEGSVREG